MIDKSHVYQSIYRSNPPGLRIKALFTIWPNVDIIPSNLQMFDVEYDFCRLLCSKFDANDPSHTMLQRIMAQTFGPALLPIPILESAEISHAALRMMTIYELERPIGTPKTHKRCRTNIDEALGQIEQPIRHRWGRGDTERTPAPEIAIAIAG